MSLFISSGSAPGKDNFKQKFTLPQNLTGTDYGARKGNTSAHFSQKPGGSGFINLNYIFFS
jgi:hypothetical protein